MDDYEKEIAKSLWTKYPDNYTPEQAIEMVEIYYDCMEKVGWYWNSDDWADRLHHVIKNGITPERWLLNIRLISEVEKIDNTLANIKKGNVQILYKHKDDEPVDISADALEFLEFFKSYVVLKLGVDGNG